MPIRAAVLAGLLAAPLCALPQPDAPESVTRVAIAGCHRQDNPAPSLVRYVETEPDVAIWIGDNVYADTEDDPSYIQACYDALEAKPAFRQFRDKTYFMPMWDDHDFGLNDYGRHYPLKEESRELFLDFWDCRDRIPADRQGVYHAQIFGEGDRTLQIIMLDGRFNRDDPGDNSDTLGEEQWAWLEAQLEKPARLRFVVSGYQYLLDRSSHFETWAKFPQARDRLFRTIRQSGAEGVVLLAGDQHYGEVSRLPGALGYDAIELMFSGINQYEPHVFNSSRVSEVAHARDAYALIDIQWEETQGDDSDVPHLVFRCFDAMSNTMELTYRINFAELQRSE